MGRKAGRAGEAGGFRDWFSHRDRSGDGCSVTKRNGVGVTASIEPFAAACAHGIETLSIESVSAYGPCRHEIVVSGQVSPEDSSLVSGSRWNASSSWQTSVRGPFLVQGRRLDGPARRCGPSMRTGQLVAPGFHATALILRTAGCWEVTGRVGDASLTPSWKWRGSATGRAWHATTCRSICVCRILTYPACPA